MKNFVTYSRSLIYIKKNKDPRFEPERTPNSSGLVDESTLLVLANGL